MNLQKSLWILGFFSTLLCAEIPTLTIKTDKEVVSKEIGVSGTLFVEENGHSQQHHPIELKRRGSSSYYFKQRQYTLEFTKEGVSLFGLPTHKKWVLYGPYVDRSLIRNALVYDVGMEMGHSRGDTWFAPRTHFFELIFNGSYEGVYLLVEKIEPGASRVVLKNSFDDKNFNPDAFSYITKIEAHEFDFSTSNGTHIQYSYPSKKQIERLKTANPLAANELKRTMHSDFESLEKSFLTQDESPPLPDYKPKIDFASLVDYVLVQEVFKNIDGYRRSVYLRKDSDGPFRIGPLWDFNLALGNVWFYKQTRAKGWNIEKEKYFDGNQPAFWFRKLFDDPQFMKVMKLRYRCLRQPGGSLSTQVLLDKIHAVETMIGSAAKRHETKWDHFPNPVHAIFFNSPRWEKNPHKCIVKLIEWLEERLEWLDKAL